HGLHREHVGGGGAVAAHPFVEHAFDAGSDGREGPDGVVEVEGDGADCETHGAIVRRRYSSSRAHPAPPPVRASTRLTQTISGTASSRPMMPQSHPNTSSARIRTRGDSCMRWPS